MQQVKYLNTRFTFLQAVRQPNKHIGSAIARCTARKTFFPCKNGTRLNVKNRPAMHRAASCEIVFAVQNAI